MTPGGSSTVHIYTQTIYRTTQITTHLEECGQYPLFASFTLAFAIQLRIKHGKNSVRVRRTSVRVQYTHYQNTHTYTHITKQYKTNTVQNKTNTVQDIPKLNSRNIINARSIKSPYLTYQLYPQELHRNSLYFTSVTSLHFTSLENKITSHKSRQFTPHHYTSHHFTY